MAKVVVTSLKAKAKGRGSAGAVTKRRVKDPSGQVKTLRILDAGSQTFGHDLGYVFGKNVAKARRDNKLAIGSADVAVKKR